MANVNTVSQLDEVRFPEMKIIVFKSSWFEYRDFANSNAYCFRSHSGGAIR
jgi:hypothetical protein